MSISVDEITATKCSEFEQETIIQISRNRDKASIWTSDNTQLTKIKRIMCKDNNSYVCTEVTKNKLGDVVGYAFECPKNLISYRTSAKRSMSDEQRKRASERLGEYHKNREEKTKDEKQRNKNNI